MNNIHFFIDANTSKGYKDFYNSNFRGIEVMKFENYPRFIAEDIFENATKIAEEQNIELEFIHNCIDNSIAGLINPKEQRAIINIMPYCQNRRLSSVNNDVDFNTVNVNMEKAYNHLKKGLLIHDDWENIYISNINFAKLNMFTSEIIDRLIPKKNKVLTGRNIDRFLGAATINGPVDYIENLTDNMKRRYFIKGRPGTGKSTFLKKIRDKANEIGYNTYTYHCSFDPDSLDMLIIPELSIAVFDSTAPHEHFPSKDTDKVIDIYKAVVKEGTDELYQNEISDLEAKYKNEIKKATDYLNRAYKRIDEIQINDISKFSDSVIASNNKKAISHLFP